MSSCFSWSLVFFFFFFNDTATTEIYTLSLHDALPIFSHHHRHDARHGHHVPDVARRADHRARLGQRDLDHHLRDRKSTRLNSSHGYISYAVFCLKKKTHTLTTQLASADRAIRVRDRMS